ncbi:MAG: hypothetical protein AAGA21_23700 [Pseudomonadota bacterium]
MFGGMFDFFSLSRRLMVWFASAIGSIIIIAVLSEFAVEFAREQGLYNQPSEAVASLFDWLSFALNPWFLTLSAGIIGFTIGLRANSFLSQKHSVGYADETPFQERLFVGQIYVYVAKLASERIIEIQIICFNGNSHDIVLLGSTGVVRLKIFGREGSEESNEKLPPAPMTEGTEVGKRKKALSDFIVAFEQRIPSEIANRISSIIDDKTVYLNFSELSIEVASDLDQTQKATLRLPTNIKLNTFDERFFFVGRVSTVVVGLTSENSSVPH